MMRRRDQSASAEVPMPLSSDGTSERPDTPDAEDATAAADGWARRHRYTLALPKHQSLDGDVPAGLVLRYSTVGQGRVAAAAGHAAPVQHSRASAARTSTARPGSFPSDSDFDAPNPPPLDPRAAPARLHGWATQTTTTPVSTTVSPTTVTVESTPVHSSADPVPIRVRDESRLAVSRWLRFTDAEVEGLYAASTAPSSWLLQVIISGASTIVSVVQTAFFAKILRATGGGGRASPGDSLAVSAAWLVGAVYPALVIINVLHAFIAVRLKGCAQELLDLVRQPLASSGSDAGVTSRARRESALALRAGRLFRTQSILGCVELVAQVVRSLVLLSTRCADADPPLSVIDALAPLACQAYADGEFVFSAAVPWGLMPFLAIHVYNSLLDHTSVTLALGGIGGLIVHSVMWAGVASHMGDPAVFMMAPMRTNVLLLFLMAVAWATCLKSNRTGRQHFAALQRVADALDDRTALMREREKVVKVNVKIREREKRVARERKFIGYLSHELRNPLHASEALVADLIADTAVGQPLLARGAEDLQTVADHLRHMHRVASDTLDVQKLQEGKLRVKPEWTDVGDLVTHVVGSYAAGARREISVHIAHDVPTRVYLDPLRFKQVLVNSVTNALKHVSSATDAINVKLAVVSEWADSADALPGGAAPVGAAAATDSSVRVAPAGGSDAQTLRLDVANEGLGLRGIDSEQLFEPFAQGHEDNAIAAQGTGLGLPICRMLARQMGGRVSLRDENGASGDPAKPVTVFEFQIPIGAPRGVRGEHGAGVAPALGRGGGAAATPESGGPTARAPMDARPAGTVTTASEPAPMAGLLPIVTGGPGHAAPLPFGEGPPLPAASPTGNDAPAMFPVPAAAIAALPVSPMSQGSAQGPGAAATTTPVAPLPRSLHCLVVDDSKSNRRVLIRMLQRIGCTADEASDGDEIDFAALSADAKRGAAAAGDARGTGTGEGHMRPQVLLMDVMMKRMNGDAACKRLRAMGVTLPIVACTGNADARDIMLYTSPAVGFTAVLPKPFSARDVRDALAALM